MCAIGRRRALPIKPLPFTTLKLITYCTIMTSHNPFTDTIDSPLGFYEIASSAAKVAACSRNSIWTLDDQHQLHHRYFFLGSYAWESIPWTQPGTPQHIAAAGDGTVVVATEDSLYQYTETGFVPLKRWGVPTSTIDALAVGGAQHIYYTAQFELYHYVGNEINTRFYLQTAEGAPVSGHFNAMAAADDGSLYVVVDATGYQVRPTCTPSWAAQATPDGIPYFNCAVAAGNQVYFHAMDVGIPCQTLPGLQLLMGQQVPAAIDAHIVTPTNPKGTAFPSDSTVLDLEALEDGTLLLVISNSSGSKLYINTYNDLNN